MHKEMKVLENTFIPNEREKRNSEEENKP